MKYQEEYRSESLAQDLLAKIRQTITKRWTIMEVCGGQTHTILKYGIEDLLQDCLELVHGPGCPVCVTPIEKIDHALHIAGQDNVIFCSFGDMLRVPGSKNDLLDLKAQGADVRVVYSPLDCLEIAKSNPDKNVVFFAVGFETTAPANALAVAQAKALNLHNFFVLVSHVTVPPVMTAILEDKDNRIDAFLGPGHVSSVMGFSDYEELSKKYNVPIVITGFEPVDLLEGIYLCLRQLESGQAKVENQYVRAVTREGNKLAKKVVEQVFSVGDRQWRGLGLVEASGYRLSDEYGEFDAEKKFPYQSSEICESKLCISAEILKGQKRPTDCSAFGRECNPENPLGATMVSSEGTCANYYRFAKS